MGRKFKPSSNANMMLTRSKNKRVISLTHFDYFDRNQQFFKIKAWTTKLIEFELSDKLLDGINFYFRNAKVQFESLVEVSFCGDNNYLQLIYIEKRKRSPEEIQELEEELADR